MPCNGRIILKAPTAQEGFELLAAHRVDVIVADQNLPDMPGAELFRRVKQMYPEAVRIMLSSANDLLTITEAINVGEVNRFFVKGRDDELLTDEIRKIFRRT